MLSLYDALEIISSSWNAVNKDVIINCWNHTKILPKKIPDNNNDKNLSDKKDINMDIIVHEDKEITNLDNKLKKLYGLRYTLNMTANEYISIENDQLVADKLTENEMINNDVIINSLIVSTVNDDKKISYESLLINSDSYDKFSKFFNETLKTNPENLCSLFYTYIQENKNIKISLENIGKIISKIK